MQRLTRHVSVIRMTNHRCEGHVDLRVVVSVIKRFELHFESVCSDVHAACCYLNCNNLVNSIINTRSLRCFISTVYNNDS